METSTLSSKYQIVIPKRLRRELNLKPGQKLRISKNKQGAIVISAKSALDDLYGSVKGGWGGDPDAHIRKMRDEMEERQQQLDKARHDS